MILRTKLYIQPLPRAADCCLITSREEALTSRKAPSRLQKNEGSDEPASQAILA